MYDETIVVAGVKATEDESTITSYATTKIYRLDLDGEPSAVQKFVDHIESFKGVAHIELLRA